ncbi:MAG TPA: SpoIIE family protein phosphatase [Streptosporangiaceae bacterium]|nr:SpoIIE family protein phosphatase [Streptosporangiaceae bacterium]
MAEPNGTDVTRMQALIARQRRELDRMRSLAATRSVIDLATGVLTEQLHCSPADARRQLARLARDSGDSVAELAAQITGQLPPEAADDPEPRGFSLAWAAVEIAADGTAVASALLDEALAPIGAVAVAVWLIEPDGGLELAGQAGFGEAEASRWRRIPPDMRALPLDVARDGAETWWPAGPPQGDDRPLMGRWPGGARAGLPLRDTGATIGCIMICWPEPAEEFAPALRRQLAALADLAANALGARLADGDQAARHRASWVFGLLDGLLDGFMFGRAVTGDDGELTDFRIDHVSPGFRDPVGRGAGELAGRQLLEMYPAAALTGGLFDRCVTVLATGEAERVAGEVAAAQTGAASTESVPGMRIARLYDGVVIAWRAADDTGRLATLLQHAQRLGRIGSWEENLRTGEVHWTEPTFALFGQESGVPVRIADLHSHVPADDIPAVQGFRDTLLAEHRETAAAFRIVRSDDGSVRQMRAYAEPVTAPAGTVIAVRGAYQDVSSDYHTRLAFAAAREQLADTEERAAEEHRLALRLQEAITPRSSEPLAAPGLDVAARYRPSGQGNLVSGDWYDTVLLPSQEILVVVGDIAGHGLDAVTGMVTVRNSLRGLAITGARPGTLLGWLNTAACQFSDAIMGTVICGLYDPASRSLRWARAGHLPPILVRGGAARTLSLPPGLLLGADPDASYTEATISLEAGDRLLLFTDGLIERRDQPIDDALDSLLAVACRPASDIASYADHVVAETSSNTDDDACLVAVHVR